jgi:hypothetical protein
MHQHLIHMSVQWLLWRRKKILTRHAGMHELHCTRRHASGQRREHLSSTQVFYCFIQGTSLRPGYIKTHHIAYFPHAHGFHLPVRVLSWKETTTAKNKITIFISRKAVLQKEGCTYLSHSPTSACLCNNIARRLHRTSIRISIFDGRMASRTACAMRLCRCVCHLLIHT